MSAEPFDDDFEDCAELGVDSHMLAGSADAAVLAVDQVAHHRDVLQLHTHLHTTRLELVSSHIVLLLQYLVVIHRITTLQLKHTPRLLLLFPTLRIRVDAWQSEDTEASSVVESSVHLRHQDLHRDHYLRVE